LVELARIIETLRRCEFCDLSLAQARGRLFVQIVLDLSSGLLNFERRGARHGFAPRLRGAVIAGPLLNAVAMMAAAALADCHALTSASSG
jgi:hypothetical protein